MFSPTISCRHVRGVESKATAHAEGYKTIIDSLAQFQQKLDFTLRQSCCVELPAITYLTPELCFPFLIALLVNICLPSSLIEQVHFVIMLTSCLALVPLAVFNVFIGAGIFCLGNRTELMDRKSLSRLPVCSAHPNPEETPLIPNFSLE